jgi:uncharacterized protein
MPTKCTDYLCHFLLLSKAIIVMKKIILFDPDSVPVEISSPSADRVLAGMPTFKSQNFYTSETENKFCGIWEAGKGKWAVAYDEWEYCHIISGEAVLTDENGDTRHVCAGDSFVIEPGFSGTWEVPAFIKKLYVINEEKIAHE